ncbi:ABC transporter permease [Streptomyces sp. NBC_01476]|uniref:ABC transporter permease n=1 Tax=Streptomyces sp. NBC_01476 TaxID=2903881 RepID=UPI002E320DF7|nr:ABC transporter permease [Streptomyces sp. NBC_01476]
MLRIGHAAGGRAESGRVRFVALLGATFFLALGFASLVAAHATYAGSVAREDARSPAVARAGDVVAAKLLWLPGMDTVNERYVTIVKVVPPARDAPLPPGVSHWPGPGESLLSPALAEQGRSEGIADRYGKQVGTIGAAGLSSPGERLAYVRPLGDAIDRSRAQPVRAFGGTTWEWVGDTDIRRPEWTFQAMLIALVLLPVGVLLAVAVRCGAAQRDRRTALIEALGGGAVERSLIVVGEALVPVCLGGLIAAAVVAVAASRDVTFPFVGYVLSARDLRAGLGPLTACVAGAVAAVLLVAVATYPVGRRASDRVRPLGAKRSTTKWAVLCPVMLLVAVRGPSLFDPGTSGYVVTNWVGVAATVVTLPAAVASLTALTGRGVARLGRRTGSPAPITAGSRVAHHPTVTARLVSGAVVAVCLLIQALVWYGQYSGEARAAQATVDRIGSSAAVLDGAKLSESQLADIIAESARPALPVALVGDPLRGLFRVQGPCGSLAALRLPCPPAGAQLPLPAVPADPRLAEMIRWYGAGAADATVRSGAVAEAGAGKDTSAVIMLISADGRDLSVPALKKAEFHVLGSSQVDTVGSQFLAGAHVNSDQGRGIAFLEVLGILVLGAAVGITGLSEFLRLGRALSPIAVLTGRRTVFVTHAALSVFAPLTAAGLLGEFVGTWAALPSRANGSTLAGTFLAACAASTTAVAALIFLWGAVVMVRETRSWRPGGG